MRYTSSATDLILAAGRHARGLGHSYVGSIHFLLALAEDPGLPGQLLRQCGVEAEMLRQMTRVLYGSGTPDMPLPQGLTGQAKRILRGSSGEAELLGEREVRPIHILLALTRREKAASGLLLNLSGVDPDTLFTSAIEALQWETVITTRRKKEAATTKLLEQFSEDLLQKAASMDPVIGRRLFAPDWL